MRSVHLVNISQKKCVTGHWCTEMDGPWTSFVCINHAAGGAAALGPQLRIGPPI